MNAPSQPSHAPAAGHALVPGAHCPRDPSRTATALCQRCGDYLCGLCARRVEAKLFCPVCAERTVESHGAHAAQALVFGLLGVHGLLPFALLAIVWASGELSAIERGEAPVGGLGLARAGFGLGVAGLVMAASGVLVWMLGSR